MQIDTFDEVMAAGMGMAPLVAIPMVALVCGVAVAVGLFRRKPLLVAAAVALVVGGISLSMSVRNAASAPASVDSLMMLLPLALVAGALPFLAGMIPAAVRAVRRRLPVREAAPVAIHAD